MRDFVWAVLVGLAVAITFWGTAMVLAQPRCSIDWNPFDCDDHRDAA